MGLLTNLGPDRRDERADADGSLLVEHSDGAEPDERGSADVGAWPRPPETASAATRLGDA
jgi:hypothetical protein